MFDRTEKTWRDTILFNPKLRSYMTYKSTFVTESYLKSFLTRHEGSILSLAYYLYISKPGVGLRNLLKRGYVWCVRGYVWCVS